MLVADSEPPLTVVVVGVEKLKGLVVGAKVEP